MIDITVAVPEDRVAEFYKFFGEWLADESPEDTPVEKQWNRERPEWGSGEEDLEKAEWLWKKLGQPAREFFSLLMDNPDQKFSSEEIVQQVNIHHGSRGVAGTLAWPGRYGMQVNRRLPSEYEYDQEAAEGLYWMKPRVAELFQVARANATAG